MTLQFALETIRRVVAQVGPAPARVIETHPDVVLACRSTKTKARRHIEALAKSGAIRSDGSEQRPVYWAATQ